MPQDSFDKIEKKKDSKIIDQPKINNYLNNYHSTNNGNDTEKVKIRSISVDPGQKYYIPQQ